MNLQQWTANYSNLDAEIDPITFTNNLFDLVQCDKIFNNENSEYF